jgi:hypothetical protein
MIFFLRYIIMTNGKQSKSNATVSRQVINGKCPPGEMLVSPGQCWPFPDRWGATARVVQAADKSLPKENARLVKQVLGGLAGLTSAACVVTAYLAAEKARKEKHVLNKVLVGAAAVGNVAAAVELGVQAYDLLMPPME